MSKERLLLVLHGNDKEFSVSVNMLDKIFPVLESYLKKIDQKG